MYEGWPFVLRKNMEPTVGAAVKYAQILQSLAIITDDFQTTAHIMTTFINPLPANAENMVSSE
jgi:hypothetical protein